MQKLYSSSLALFVTLGVLTVGTDHFWVNKRPSQSTFAVDFCGNKHKNLVLLDQILQHEPGVMVPQFSGISTGRIEAFLRKHDPTIFTDYARLTSHLQPLSLVEKIHVRSRKNTVKELLIAGLIESIQSKIQACFAQNTFEFNDEELKLFEHIAQQQQFFMVRSTGIEDGAIANAGGNVSLAYVVPQVHAISQAMSQVVASYFGMQSLKNRIGGGEILSVGNLCLPVLIQVLIGENLNSTNSAAIPVSGVAYTTNQSLSNQTFAVTEINAAYGHGEGVVANRVMADRYYVLPSRLDANDISIYPMIYLKSERLVPYHNPSSNVHTLMSCNNKDELAYQSALSSADVRRLYTVLKKIELTYGQPMDVEFVVLDKVIYIVQARPAMHVDMQPSYLDLNKIDVSANSNKMTGDIIVPGKAQVLVITDPSDIIVTNTLDDADQHANSTKCKMVFVDTWASSLSHAAVNFKTYGTPCIKVDDIGLTRQLIARASLQTPLVLDIQQKTFLLWQNDARNIEDCINQGWLEHPIERTVSTWMTYMPVLTAATNPAAQDAQLMGLLQELKKATDNQIQINLLVSITQQVQFKISITQERIIELGNLCDENLKQHFDAYKLMLNKLLAEFTASLERKASFFEMLFYHKMLEAMIYQTPTTKQLLAGYEYAYFLNKLNAQQMIFTIKKKLGVLKLMFADFF